MKKHSGWWTYDPQAKAYYFAPSSRTPGPYLHQLEVLAILDVASDDTLAGVELVMGKLPPPPEMDGGGQLRRVLVAYIAAVIGAEGHDYFNNVELAPEDRQVLEDAGMEARKP